MTQRIVTAQRLSDGRVVYLREDRTWARSDAEAFVSADAAVIEALVAWATTQTEIIVDPYGIEVELGEDGAIRHTSMREQLRAEGPPGVLARFGYLRRARPTRAVG